MEYLFPAGNIVADAAITMTNAVPSNAIERTDEAPKAGGGDVRLTGPFTGASNATVDVQIVDNTIDGVPSHSAPVFSGVGNGQLTGIATDAGGVAEVITLVLENLGTETRHAQAPFQGVILEAAEPGPRAIAVEIARNLVLADTDYSLREALQQDARDLRGDHYNWGHALLLPDGTVPTTAPRVRVGDDHQVFRLYRDYDRGLQDWLYNMSPRPPRAIPAGARVRAVTGDYTVTITDATGPGAAVVETFSGIQTLYDALDAIRNGSDIVTVRGAIILDRTPGGMAATDLSVQTASYCAAIDRDGGELVQRADLGLVVAPGAPTEVLTITCIDGNNFAVRGDVSGDLASAIAGVLYDNGPYQFRIPLPAASSDVVGPQALLEFIPAEREGGAPAPQLCDARVMLGPNARNGTYEFVYDLRPVAPCPCDDVEIDSPPSEDCIGTQPQEVGTVSENARQVRVQRGTAWLREFTRANTPLYIGRSADLEYVNKGWGILAAALGKMMKGKLTRPGWAAATEYDADEIIAVGVYRYATSGGTSGGSAPTFPATVGATVSDNGMTWTNIGLMPLQAWDAAFDQFRSDAAFLQADTGPAIAGNWAPGLTNIASGTIVQPSTPTGFTYFAEPNGSNNVTGGTEPTWPTTEGEQVDDNGIIWTCRGAYWQPETVYAAGDRAVVPSVGAFVCETGGESGVSMPPWSGEIDRVTSDGAAAWRCVGRLYDTSGTKFEAPNLTSPVSTAHLQRVVAAANDVLAAAGLSINFEVPGSGDGCWVDDPTKPGAFYYNGSDEPPYVPVLQGHWYVASKPVVVDGEAQIMSTREFAFPAAPSCPDSLIRGDKFRLVIWNVNGVNGGYQQADQFQCLITHGAPLALAGGQLGNDTLTWSCISSARGRLPDYQLVLTAPAAYTGAFVAGTVYAVGTLVRPATPDGYCYRVTAGGAAGAAPAWPASVGATVTTGDVTFVCETADPGLAFQLSQGGIRYALGDAWEFAIEGGHFRYRVDGGAWSSAIAIAPTVTLVDGLVAVFAGGRPPSWVAPDTWSFGAAALNGADNLRRPDDLVARWSDSTAITVTPDAGRPALAGDLLLILDHEIPGGATLTLSGSDDDFATTEFSAVLPWRRRNVMAVLPQACAAYRLAVSAGGGIRWLPIGRGLQLRTPNTQAHIVGQLVKQHVLPSSTRRGGLGCNITHEAVSATTFDQLLDQLEACCESDGRRFAIVTNRDEAEAGLVRFAADTLPVPDGKAYEPRDPVHRWLTVEMALEPAA